MTASLAPSGSTRSGRQPGAQQERHRVHAVTLNVLMRGQWSRSGPGGDVADALILDSQAVDNGSTTAAVLARPAPRQRKA